MKQLGDFEIGEYVRPIIPKFYCSGPFPFVKECGGMFVYQLQEYLVSKKFESTPRATKAQVRIEDGYRLAYLFDWHTPFIGRYEAAPSPEQLISVINKLHDNNQLLVKQYIEELPVKFKPKTNQVRLGKSVPGARMFCLRLENLAAVEKMPKQAKIAIAIFREMENHEEGVTEADLMEALRKNAARFNSVQDAWRIFSIYLKGFMDAGMIEVQE